MKKFFLSAVAISVSMFAWSLAAPSAAYAAGSPKNANTPKNETYIVIKVGDEYKVIGTSHYKDEQKKATDDYTQKLKEWKDERKTDPNAPHPVKAIIKRIGTPYETQKIAQEYADKLKKEAEDKDSGDQTHKDNRK